MKTSSLAALVFSLAIASVNVCHAPALAEMKVMSHIAELPASSAVTNDAEAVNLTLVQRGDKYGYKDERGRMVIAAQFDNAYEFFDGLAAVKVGNKWGFIDEDGEMAIAPQFDNAETFSEGMAKVQIGNKWGFINPDGKIAISPKFDEVASFHDDVAWVRIGNQVGYINEAGKFVQ